MKPITTDDELAEHSRVLGSDLDSLFKLVFTHRKPLAEGDIRLASVILRKWLTDGLLGHYCHVAGVVPTLEALDTAEMCDAVAAHPDVNYFLAAGTRTRPWVGRSSGPVPLSASQSCPGYTTITSGCNFRKGQVLDLSDSVRRRRCLWRPKLFRTKVAGRPSSRYVTYRDASGSTGRAMSGEPGEIRCRETRSMRNLVI
jgi:hypothetical protein